MSTPVEDIQRELEQMGRLEGFVRGALSGLGCGLVAAWALASLLAGPGDFWLPWMVYGCTTIPSATLVGALLGMQAPRSATRSAFPKTLGKAMAVSLLGSTAAGGFLGFMGGLLGASPGELLARVLEGSMYGAGTGLVIAVVALPLLGPLAFLMLRKRHEGP